MLSSTNCYLSQSFKWQIKPAAGQMNEERGLILERTYPSWSGRRCSSSCFRSKLAHVRDTRSSNQQRCQKGHGLRDGFPVPEGWRRGCLLQPREVSEHGVRAVRTKPSPLNFPTLLCSFLCCRPCSDCPSHCTEIFILPQTQKL